MKADGAVKVLEFGLAQAIVRMCPRQRLSKYKSVALQMDDVLITRAEGKHDQLLAIAMTDAQRVPSAIVPGGIFLTRAYTRLPDQNDKDDR